MRRALKWTGIGCGCFTLGIVGLFVVLVGMELGGVGLSRYTPTPTPRPAAAAALAEPPAAPTALPTTIVVAPTPIPTSLPTPTEAPPPTATVAPAAPAAPTPTAAAQQRPPTAPPAPDPAILFSGRFQPSLLRVGQKLVIELTMENKSPYALGGIRLFSNGPWDKYTVVSVTPNGRFESGLLGQNISLDMQILTGEKRTIIIVAYPNEPGNHEFTFIPYHATTQKLRDPSGADIVIGGKVNVTR